MKALKIFKWTGIGLVMLVGIGLAFIYGRSHHLQHLTLDIPLQEIRVPTDSAAIADGFRQTRLMHCNGCHGDNMGGEVMVDDDIIGRLVSANASKIVKAYSDAELYRLLRHGVKRDNSLAIAMPAEMLYELKEESLLNIIAYLRTLEEVEHETPFPPNNFKFPIHLGLATGQMKLEPLKMDHIAPRRFDQHENTPIAHGEYLVHTACSHCHGKDLTGDEFMQSPGLSIVFMYSQEQFRHLLRTGEGVTRKDVGMMSEVVQNCLHHFTDEEINDMYAFLKTLLEEEEGVGMD
jgi:mono/diheme cytochrome c family protein